MDEKLKLAFELRKQGLSLKKIELQTGISFRELSVIFKYLNDNNISLKEEKRIFESKINLLQQENKKLKELLKEEEKEKKDLATQVAVNRYSIKILKPTFFVLIVTTFFMVGAGLGLGLASKNYVKTFLNKVYQLDKKNKQILELKENLIAKYQNDKIALKNKYLKELNEKTKLNNFLKMYDIKYKIIGNLVEFKSSNNFEIRYLDDNDNPIVTDVPKLIIAVQ